MATEGFVGRWSRLKRVAKVQGGQATTEEERAPLSEGAASQVPTELANSELASPALGNSKSPAAPSGGSAGIRQDAQSQNAISEPLRDQQGRAVIPPLPSIESLGKDSDFSVFMRAEVDPKLRVSALKKLFTDPHFNRMDGLDIYIDDYSKPDPMPLAFIRRLDQSRILGLSEEPAPEAPRDEATPDGVTLNEATPEATLDQATLDQATFDEPTPASNQEAVAEAAPGEPSSPEEAPHPERVA